MSGTDKGDLTAQTASCANCGASLIGEYCYSCGQRRVDPLSFKALAGDLVENVVDFEHSKMWRSLRALVIHPGLLTTEYLAGRRAAWITPIRIYLFVFAISFFLYSAFKTVAVYDLSTLLTADRQGTISNAIAHLAEKKHLAIDAFIAVVNAKWHTFMSAAQFLYPLIFALVLKLFYIRRRLVEHLVFSMHYQALVLVITILAWPIYRLTGVTLTHNSAILAVITTLMMIVYLLLAVRTVYSQSWPVSIVKGVFLYLAYYVIFAGITYSMLSLAILSVMKGKS